MRTSLRLIYILALYLLTAVSVRAQGPVTAPPPLAPPEHSFNLAQAYPGFPQSYLPALGIADQACFRGAVMEPAGPSAVPGLLCLARRGLELDVNCFVSPPPNARGPCYVQSYKLYKFVPGRGLIVQIGKSVRTWWSLNFTPPGTIFTLVVYSVCPTSGPDSVLIQQDVYSWRIEANPATMLRLIELMHAGAVGTLEIPCILAEDTHDSLVSLVGRLDEALSALECPPTSEEVRNAQAAVFDLELFLFFNCLSIDIAEPLVLFPGTRQFGEAHYQPPGNLAMSIFANSRGSVAGILDTVEHPCCSTLFADLSWIASQVDISVELELPSPE